MGLGATLQWVWLWLHSSTLAKSDQSLRLAKLLIWGPKSGRPDSRQVPWSNCTTHLVLQNKAAGWNCYWALPVGTILPELVCQDLSASCHKCLSTYLFTVKFQVTEPLRVPWNLRRKNPELGLPTILRGLDGTPELSFFSTGGTVG